MMLSPADRIVDTTLKYTLRPKGNDREKVIAAALEFVILEYSYTDGEGENLIDVRDLQELITELRDTETLEEPPELNPKLIELGKKWMLEHDETLRKLADS